jgi:hypothetical protein
MTKAELIEALEPYPDDIELIAVSFYEEFYFPDELVSTYIHKGKNKSDSFTSTYDLKDIDDVNEYEMVLRIQ